MTAEKGQKATEAYTYIVIFNLKESTAQQPLHSRCFSEI